MTRPIVIMGGGLWGGLLAYTLQKRRPELDYILVEGKETFGGNHTWSFHESDLSRESFELVRPFIKASWNEYSVQFPSLKRTIKLPYHSISSRDFHELLLKELPKDRVRLNEMMTTAEATSLSDLVFDTRGTNEHFRCGYQKFLGLEIETEMPHGLTSPILMDANVEQIDGFRFIYYLPFSETTLLIEDTRYSDNSFIDHFRMNEQVLDLVRRNGWKIKNILREEHGALPIPYDVPERFSDERILDLKGLFHDTTGYSLPDALRLIPKIVDSELSYLKVKGLIDGYRKQRTNDRKFFCLLNRFMFLGSPQESRYKTLEFFYRSSPSLIKKFYAGEMSAWDKVRFFAGKPPIALRDAFRVLFGNAILTKETAL
jgi:lycopene beta-cyclase